MKLRHDEHQHHHHHGSSLVYGQVVFVLSLAYLCGVYVLRLVENRWNRKISVSLHIQILAWSAILMVLAFYKVDLATTYGLAINRFGRLSYCLIPLDMLVALRFDSNIVFYLEQLDFHKWLSRLIMVAGILHSLGYLGVWYQQGTLVEKLLRILNFWGVVVFIAFIILVVVSIGFFRRRYYQWFYVFHNITVFLFIYLILLHARPGVTFYGVVCAVVAVIQLVLREFRCFNVMVTVSAGGNSALKIIRIEKPVGFQWPVAGHLRLTYLRTNPKHWLFASHPYTIASLPQDDYISLVVKPGANFTFDPTANYCMTGPFAALPSHFLATAEKVVVLCGGSGIAFGAPVFRALKSKLGSDVSLVWSVRTPSDLYILDEMSLSAHDIDVYVTGNTFPSQLDEEENVGLLHDDIELQPVASPSELGKINKGRPNLKRVCLRLRAEDEVTRRNLWIVVCGPDALIDDAKLCGSANGINVISEVYAM